MGHDVRQGELDEQRDSVGRLVRRNADGTDVLYSFPDDRKATAVVVWDRTFLRDDKALELRLNAVEEALRQKGSA